jgi:GR25 family glycosyltransferase involved in LPS biosynthesis
MPVSHWRCSISLLLLALISKHEACCGPGSEIAWEEWAPRGLLHATVVASSWTQGGREEWLKLETSALADHERVHGPVTFDSPAYVMNLAHRKDRRKHSETLLRALGFSNILFPQTIAAADIDYGTLISQGWLTHDSLSELASRAHLKPDAAKRSYIANTVGHLSALRDGLESGSEFIFIFEDDLLPSDSLAHIKDRLRHILELLRSPRSFHSESQRPAHDHKQHAKHIDLFFLEYCYEECQAARTEGLDRAVHADGPSAGCPLDDFFVADASKPLCSAAIVYTREGARRVLELCIPIFDGIDGMLPALIANASLHALIAPPPLFYQVSLHAWAQHAVLLV